MLRNLAKLFGYDFERVFNNIKQVEFYSDKELINEFNRVNQILFRKKDLINTFDIFELKTANDENLKKYLNHLEKEIRKRGL